MDKVQEDGLKKGKVSYAPFANGFKISGFVDLPQKPQHAGSLMPKAACRGWLLKCESTDRSPAQPAT